MSVVEEMIDETIVEVITSVLMTAMTVVITMTVEVHVHLPWVIDHIVLHVHPWKFHSIVSSVWALERPRPPLEERPRHLKNWDAAPAGFERISADKAKLTGLFPPPGNIAKTANYVPPTLDPARAAMFQLLNKDGVPSSSSMMPNSNIDASAPGIPANLLKQAKRFYIGNLPLDVSEQSLLQFLESNLRSLSGSTDKSTEYSHLNTLDNRVLNITVSTDRSYAFVECRSADDASPGNEFDGVILGVPVESA